MNTCDYCGNIFNYYPSQHRYYSKNCQKQYLCDKKNLTIQTLTERIHLLQQKLTLLQPTQTTKLYEKIYKFLKTDKQLQHAENEK